MLRMASILPTDTEKIEDLGRELIGSLEGDANGTRDTDAIRARVAQMATAVGPLLGDPGADNGGNTNADIEGGVLPAVEAAYESFKAADAAFASTLQRAYRASVPRSNLVLDQVQTALRETVGDPLARRYTELHKWLRNQREERPWDGSDRKGPAHVDRDRLGEAITALVRGDDLDVEDALVALTGTLRHAFADHIETHAGEVNDLEIGVWKRPEILIARDYWGRDRANRIVDILREKGSRRFADALGTIDRFFTPSAMSAAGIVAELRDIPDIYRERFTRCLMLHPDNEVRRYAVTNADANSIWKVVSSDVVPCATILSVLEHIAGGPQTVAQRKVFFDAIYRRLLSVTSRSDVLYARGIARLLTRMDFFVEDDYFARLSHVLDYLSAKEQMFGIRDGLMDRYMKRLRQEKERTGSRPSDDPSFAGVPLVILRKLARDGHFWFLLSMHPIVKISRETVPYINDADRAFRMAGNHRVNQEVIRVVGRRRHLFTRLSARMALLANPKTPPMVSLDYVTDLSRRDIEGLLRRSGIHPELRTMLRNRLHEMAR